MTNTAARTNGEISASELLQEFQSGQLGEWSCSYGGLRKSFTQFQLGCFISGTE